MLQQALTEQLALDLAIEPRRLYKPEQLVVPGRFALCMRRGTGGRIDQQLYDVGQLDSVMRQVARMPERDRSHVWISQATLAPYAVNRRISSIMLLNANWVDIDLAHPPEGWAGTLPPGDPDRDAERLAACLAMQIEDLGLPAPSQIVATGGGLLPRWNYITAVPAVARPRWQSVQTELIKRISDIRHPECFGGDGKAVWPVDASASDPSRVLRLIGTVNPRWGTRCRVVWESGRAYDFDEFANAVLPYTREQVHAFWARMREFNQWTENRRIAAEAGIRRPGSWCGTVDAAIEDEAARSLWSMRLTFGRAVLEGRGGVPVGSRNNTFWPMANALAWSCTGVEELMHELAALHHDLFRGGSWSRGEAMQSAAAVIGRLRDGRGELYKMKTSKFIRKYIQATPQEIATFGHLLTPTGDTHNVMRGTWQIGAMGFEPMQGLTVEQYIAETKRRQAEAGRRSAEDRKSNHDEETKRMARQLAASGLSVRSIAAQLRAGKSSVARWVKGD